MAVFPKTEIMKKPQFIKINDEKEVFCGTRDELEIIDGEYCLFVLGNEKFETITYLTECFYGKTAAAGNI